MWISFQGPDGERTLPIGAGEFVIGRADDCSLTLDDPKVSRHHAALRALGDGRLEVRDLGSSNGTFVGERRLTAPEALGTGALFRTGGTTMRVLAADPASAGATRIEPIPAPPPAAAVPPLAAAATPQAQPAPPPARSRSVIDRSRSTIERVRLGKAVRRATIIGGIAVVIGIAAIVLLVFNVTGSDDSTPTTADIAAAVAPSTVLVLAENNNERQGNGTGWVYDAKKGLIVTNAHVVNAGTEMRIGVDGKERSAKVLGVAPCEDLAVLQVSDTSGLKTLPLAEQSKVKSGDTVVAVGFPGTASSKDELTTTSGVVSRPRTTFDLRAQDVPLYRNVVQTDAAINPGNSGGPLVDTDKQLVGVNSSLGLAGTQNQNYAIGSDRVKAIVPGLAAGKSISWTGMLLVYADPAQLTKRGLPPGILIPDAYAGTPAARAGLSEGAPLLLTAIDGKSVGTTLQGYCKQVEGLTSDDKTPVFTFTSASGRQQNVRIPFA